jgi:enoyl-CoA hydratase/carnithine racemase
MQYEDIILKKEGNIATMIMNRPDKMNAASLKMRQEMPVALDEVHDKLVEHVRRVTLVGDRQGLDPQRQHQLHRGEWDRRVPGQHRRQ